MFGDDPYPISSKLPPWSLNSCAKRWARLGAGRAGFRSVGRCCWRSLRKRLGPGGYCYRTRSSCGSVCPSCRRVDPARLGTPYEPGCSWSQQRHAEAERPRHASRAEGTALSVSSIRCGIRPELGMPVDVASTVSLSRGRVRGVCLSVCSGGRGDVAACACSRAVEEARSVGVSPPHRRPREGRLVRGTPVAVCVGSLRWGRLPSSPKALHSRMTFCGFKRGKKTPRREGLVCVLRRLLTFAPPSLPIPGPSIFSR